MKRSRPPSLAASYENITISKSKLEKLIQQEVNIALAKKETRVDRLLESIQELDYRIDYEGSLQRLEAQITKVTKRSEAVLAYMTKAQKKNPLEFCNDAEISRMNPEEETMETRSYEDTNSTPASLADFSSSDFMEKSKELSEIMENTMKVVEKLRADNTALNAAISDLTAERVSPVSTSHAVLANFIKNEPADDIQSDDTIEEPLLKVPKVEPFLKVPKVEPLLKVPKVEPFLKVPKVEPFCPDYQQETELSHPPLPPIPSSLTLHPEAASYNVPQRLTVKLALIKRPACLSVLWTVDEKDPLAPPMDTYSIYMSTEKVKGSNVFPYWKLVETVKALPLPMFKMVTDYQPGHKVCVVVVGKDIFGRYGPYSHVVIATIPEDE